MTSARKIVVLRRRKKAFYFVALKCFGIFSIMSPDTATKRIAQIRRKGPVDALEVYLACLEFGFFGKTGGFIRLNEVTDEMFTDSYNHANH